MTVPEFSEDDSTCNNAQVMVDSHDKTTQPEGYNPLHISRIVAGRLFGQYSYDLHSDDTDLSKLLILYGDNGSGKTTILRSLFHLLSPARNKRHRSELARVPFRRFCVTLGEDTVVAAERLEGNAVRNLPDVHCKEGAGRGAGVFFQNFCCRFSFSGDPAACNQGFEVGEVYIL